MTKTIILDGKTIPLSTSLSWVGIFRNQFYVDPLTIFIPLAKLLIEAFSGEKERPEALEEALYQLKFEDLLHLVWALAKNANPELSPPEKWLSEFSSFPLDEILPEVGSLLLQSLISKKKYDEIQKGFLKRPSATKSSS